MFSMAFMPSYILPAALKLIRKDCLINWLSVFIALIIIAGVCNFMTLKILSRVASVKQMDSYQEVAYNISNSNRGYIFLISSAKFIFMAVTVSFNIDYCASYLASLFIMSSDDLTSGQKYGFYVAGVIITALILVIPYWRLQPQDSFQHQREKLALPAYILSVCFCL